MGAFYRRIRNATVANATFYAPLRWQREVQSGRRTGRDRLVLTCSWSDWWINEADVWRDDAWSVIRRCPDLIFQTLTKRLQRIAKHLRDYWEEIRDRVWLGISAENQEEYDTRRQFVDFSLSDKWWWSLEPILGLIDLRLQEYARKPLRIVGGGESGPNYWQCETSWIRSVVEQCQVAGVPVFVKQDSGFKSGMQGRIPSDLWAVKELPSSRKRMRQAANDVVLRDLWCLAVSYGHVKRRLISSVLPFLSGSGAPIRLSRTSASITSVSISSRTVSR
jgi:protein gp37